MTNGPGFAWSFAALSNTINEVDDPARGHAHARIGAALLWICVVNDVFFQVVGTDYTVARAADGDGRVIPGLQMAFNGLKHGAALVADIRDLTGLPGMRIGPREWIPYQQLRLSLDREPSSEQKRSYSDHIQRRLFEQPLQQAYAWLVRAEKTWDKSILASIPTM